jgi:4-alpha-glucanotransferase
MNRPGEAAGNWAWRLEPQEPGRAAAARLRALAEAHRRV